MGTLLRRYASHRLLSIVVDQWFRSGALPGRPRPRIFEKFGTRSRNVEVRKAENDSGVGKIATLGRYHYVREDGYRL